MKSPRGSRSKWTLDERVAWGRLYMVLLHYIESMKVKGRYSKGFVEERPQPREDFQEPRKGLIRTSSSSYIIR